MSAGTQPAVQPTSRRTNGLTAAWLLLAAVCVLAFFWKLGGCGIWDLDEGLYAEAAREMRLSGDWIVPRVNHVPFFEKPPLIYWQAAALFSVAGHSEVTARLPSAVATLLLVFLTAWVGVRFFGPRSGLLAGYAFALSPLVLAESRQLITDATLDLWIAVAVFSFLGVQASHDADHGDGPTAGQYSERAGRWLPYAFWVACALGVLTKGLPGVLVPCVTTSAYLALRCRGNWADLAAGVRSMRPAIGIGLFLLIASPWHLAAWHRAGDAFYDEYIIRQHLGRFRGGDTAHPGPFWYYAPVFLLGALPWGVLFPTALFQRIRGQAAGTQWSTAETARLLLKVWVVTVFVMFSVSGSKLVSYILPMFPPAALLTADWWVRTSRTGRVRAILLGMGAAAILAALIAAVLLFREPIAAAATAQTHRPVRLDTVPAELFQMGFWLVATALAGILACLLLTLARRPHWAMAALVSGMAGVAGLAVLGLLPALDKAFLAPLHDLAREAGRLSEPDRPVLLTIGSPRRPSALFYLPDRLLATQSGAPGVIEATDERRIRALIAAHPNVVVLTDGKHAPIVASMPRMRVEDESREWRVMEE